MSRVINVSNDLGKRLLEGWTPSDRTCPAETCRGIPLLSSPAGCLPVTWFCPSCEGDGSVRDPSQSEMQRPSSPSLSSSTHYSRHSTPPTEESHDLSSPTFALPEETEESIRRRQQSDFASAEIGNRLLKGWAMLADECPGSSCYGIPLVRPPKSGRNKNPPKECVVCGTVYVTDTERKTQGLDPLALGALSETRREEVATSSMPAKALNTTTKGKRKASVPEVFTSVPSAVGNPKVTYPTTSALPVTSSLFRDSNPPLQTSSNHAFSEPVSTSDDVLAGSDKALRATLSTLSQRLLLLSGQEILDPVTISQTADAIARTGQALAVINTLRRSQE